MILKNEHCWLNGGMTDMDRVNVSYTDLSFTKCDSQGAETVVRKWSRDKIRNEKEKLTEEIIQATKDINSVKAEVNIEV